MTGESFGNAPFLNEDLETDHIGRMAVADRSRSETDRSCLASIMVAQTCPVCVARTPVPAYLSGRLLEWVALSPAITGVRRLLCGQEGRPGTQKLQSEFPQVTSERQATAHRGFFKDLARRSAIGSEVVQHLTDEPAAGNRCSESP